jgi:predicted MFS family arabinose efflux permease
MHSSQLNHYKGGIILSWGQFQATYELNQLRQESESTIAWIGSLQAFLAMFVGIFSGALYDLGYLHHLLISGSSLVVLGFMATASSTKLWHFFLAQSVCCGTGCGLLWVPALSNIVAWFPPERRGRAMSVASIGAGVGAITYPIIFRSLQRHTSFAWAVRTMAFVLLGTLLLCILVSRDQPASVRSRRSILDYSAFRDIPFMVVLLGYILTFSGLYTPMFYYPDFVIRKQVAGEDLAFYLLAVFSGASIPGRIIPVYLSSRWTGPVNMIIITTALSSILAFVWMAVRGVVGAVLFAVGYGFITGAVVTIGTLVPVPFSPSPNAVGARLGMCSGASAIGALFGAPSAGAILKDFSYTAVQIFTGSFLAGGAGLFLLGRFLKTRGKLMEKI